MDNLPCVLVFLRKPENIERIAKLTEDIEMPVKTFVILARGNRGNKRQFCLAKIIRSNIIAINPIPIRNKDQRPITEDDIHFIFCTVLK